MRVASRVVGVAIVSGVMSLGGAAVANAAGPLKGAAARQQALLSVLRAAGGATTGIHTPNDGDLADQAPSTTTSAPRPRLGLGARP